MFEYAPGVLVKSKTQGEMGIVLKVLPHDHLEIFMGDGLPVIDRKSCWDIVPFNDYGAIPASFAELLVAQGTPLDFLRERNRLTHRQK